MAVSEEPEIRWEDVAGLQSTKRFLEEAIILPIKFPQLSTGQRKHCSGILLYGAPGVGKSHLAKAVATKAGASFFHASSTDFVSKWLVESEKFVRDVFESARERKPSVVLLDDIDTLYCGESESALRIRNELVRQMSGAGPESEGVFVLATTNRPWLLDEAVRIRFAKRMFIPLPDANAREEIFKIMLRGMSHELSDDDFMLLGRETVGYSGADISVVVRDALIEPVREVQQATHFKRVRGMGPDQATVRDEMLTPCSPSEEGAMEMAWMDIPGERLLLATTKMTEMQRAVNNWKPTVSSGDIEKLKKFHDDFGQCDI